MGIIAVEKDHGVTKDSLEFFRENEPFLKGDPTVVVRNDSRCFADYRTTIVDAKGNVIELSGLSLGYAGEGPNGLSTVLTELGLPFDEQQDIFSPDLTKCGSTVHVFTRGKKPRHLCLLEE